MLTINIKNKNSKINLNNIIYIIVKNNLFVKKKLFEFEIVIIQKKNKFTNIVKYFEVFNKYIIYQNIQKSIKLIVII